MLSITQQAVNFMWDSMQIQDWKNCKLWFEIVCIECRTKARDLDYYEMMEVVDKAVTYLINNIPCKDYSETDLVLTNCRSYHLT